LELGIELAHVVPQAGVVPGIIAVERLAEPAGGFGYGKEMVNQAVRFPFVVSGMGVKINHVLKSLP